MVDSWTESSEGNIKRATDSSLGNGKKKKVGKGIPESGNCMCVFLGRKREG